MYSSSSCGRKFSPKRRRNSSRMRRARCTSISPGTLTVVSSPYSRPRKGRPSGSVSCWARGGPSLPGWPLGPGPNMPCCCIDWGEVLRAAAQSFERAALGIDRAVRVAFSKLTFRLAHGVAGAAELIHLALPSLALAEALLAQLLHQL